MGAAPTRNKVLKYLTDNANLIVWVGTMAEELSLTEKQIQYAVWSLQRSGLHDIRTEAPGHAWTYFGPVQTSEAAATIVAKHSDPNPHPTSAAFTLLAHATNGDAFLQDPQGNLWRATQL